MLITGPEGFSPIQKKTARPAAFPGPGRRQVQDGYYDQYTASAPAAPSGSSSGQYQISPSETAARMLLLDAE